MSEKYDIHPITGEQLPPATAASTLIIMRDANDGGAPELLMVERSAKMVFAAGAAVFPGGRVDDADFAYANDFTGYIEDEAACRIAAIRETLEESGLALGVDGIKDQAQIDAARTALHSGKTMQEICENFGWTLDLDQLVPWSRWRPPAFETRRVFDTRFYIINAGKASLNAKVDATENRILFWANAQEVLRRADLAPIEGAKNEAVHIIFPTRRNLERLALFDNFADTAEHADEFDAKMVMTYTEKREDGMWLCIPDGHGFPVIEESFEVAKRG